MELRDMWSTTSGGAEDAKRRQAISYITEEQTKDKGKSGVLGKVIAVAQTTWFVVQCIARHYKGLVVTQLEVVTIAFAALNFMTYALWWHKPSDVDCAISIPFDDGLLSSSVGGCSTSS